MKAVRGYVLPDALERMSKSGVFGMSVNNYQPSTHHIPVEVVPIAQNLNGLIGDECSYNFARERVADFGLDVIPEEINMSKEDADELYAQFFRMLARALERGETNA